MRVMASAIAEVLVIEPKVFGDERGLLFESYNRRDFSRETGVEAAFVQENHSCSSRNVLRGLHYQIRQAQGRLVRAVAGEVFDVAVDLRRSSRTFGRWVSQVLSADNRQILWIPPGFAHGFLTLSERAEVLYMCTDYYAPEHERCIAWNDADIAIAWPLVGAPVLSEKDKRGVALRTAEIFP